MKNNKNIIYNILIAAYGKADPDILKCALDKAESANPKNINDFYYITFQAVIENKKITKVAYPSFQGALTDEIPEEYDLEKWSSLVYKIYDAVESGDMSFHNALDYYSGFLDAKNGEDFRFKKWVNYYRDGEHRKYNKNNEESMEKKSKYQFSLNDPGLYAGDYIHGLEEEHPIHKIKEDGKLKDEYKTWKNKLYAAIRRIDKLLRQSEDYIDTEYQNELADHLHNFDMELRKVKMHSTASDLAYRQAESFRKLGFNEGAEILNKFAQEAPPMEEEIVPEEIAAEPEDFGVAEAAPPAEAPGAPVAPPIEGDDVEPVPEKSPDTPLGRALHESVGNPHEYKDLSGEITLDIAATKLEEVAAKLADRRTIRLLAEFDIMLDKLGIAAMFPELAESQSKLIDAYSYALTRVTKMLGMLSSGKSLVELSETRQSEIENKTMKDVQKDFETANEPLAPAVEPGEAIQRDLEVEPAPEATTPPPEAPLPETTEV